jgi:hypothetical protein
MTAEIVGYAFEPSDYRELQVMCRRLFGDGTHMTTDQRRDLANLLHVLIGRAVAITEDSRDIERKKIFADMDKCLENMDRCLTECIEIVQRRIAEGEK